MGWIGFGNGDYVYLSELSVVIVSFSEIERPASCVRSEPELEIPARGAGQSGALIDYHFIM